MDSPRSGARENLTLALLGEHLGQAGLTKAKAEFNAVLAQLLMDATAIQKLRNKVLGHSCEYLHDPRITGFSDHSPIEADFDWPSAPMPSLA